MPVPASSVPLTYKPVEAPTDLGNRINDYLNVVSESRISESWPHIKDENATFFVRLLTRDIYAHSENDASQGDQWRCAEQIAWKILHNPIPAQGQEVNVEWTKFVRSSL
jgi:hypothetical protein